MFRTNVLTTLAFACSLSFPAFAEQADREKPMNISADNCLYDQKAAKSVCTSNVVVTQGTMTIRADRLVISQDADGNQFAQGEVAFQAGTRRANANDTAPLEQGCGLVQSRIQRQLGAIGQRLALAEAGQLVRLQAGDGRCGQFEQCLKVGVFVALRQQPGG